MHAKKGIVGALSRSYTRALSEHFHTFVFKSKSVIGQTMYCVSGTETRDSDLGIRVQVRVTGF